MKKVQLIILALVLFASHAFSQTAYNPFTQNIHFEPEPSPAGFQCGTTQTVAFTMGLTTAANATDFINNPLTVTISVTGFRLVGTASSIVSGSYASNFDWAFDSFDPNGTIIGTQKQTLIGTGSNPIFPDPLSSGEILLSIYVPETSPISTVLAVNVNLQVPGYMQQFNSTPDDNESTQTQTYCPLRISGTLFNDRDSINVSVNGTPISDPDTTTMYANLMGPNNTVVAVTPITANGTYEFLNVAGNTDYTVILSMNPGTVGGPAPINELPGTWVNTGEDCCDKTGNDGNPDGVISVSVTNFTKLNVDFGIKDPSATGFLPVVLKNFFVSEYNCGGLLSWTTSQEANTSHVEIYRKESTQGMFRKIASVKSAGASSTEKVYSYLDAEVSQDATYEYQLKFVDLDGQYTVSDIKTLKLDCTKENTSINIFPNPATSQLNILYVTEADQADLTVEVVDITGRTILSNSKLMKNGGNVLTLDISSIAVGTYLLQYHDVEGLTVGAIKFIKQ